MWAREHGLESFPIKGLPLHLPVARQIRKWLSAHTALGREEQAPIARGCFYYDGAFWRVGVPFPLGKSGPINVFAQIQEMQPEILRSLAEDSSVADDYAAYFSDLSDYVLGRGEIPDSAIPTPFAAVLLDAAERHWEATVALLLERYAEKRASETSRDATEIYLKALLACRDGLEKRGAVKLSHNLSRTFDWAARFFDPATEAMLRPAVLALPDITERYAGAPRTRRDLWEIYRTAQGVATAVVRVLSGRDSRA